jgi:hypothetical protein
MAKRYGGVSDDSSDKGRAAFTALMKGGAQASMPYSVAIVPMVGMNG